MQPTPMTLNLALFIFGLMIGSFLNVCIYRLPAGGSVADPPRSVCPKCGGAIAFYDNIPVLSYFWLRGRCRHCGEPISIQYPLVEITSGVFALLVAVKFGFTLEALLSYLFIAALLVISVIDMNHRIIPDVSLPGIPLGVIAALAVPSMTFKDSIIGLLAGGGSLLAVAWAYRAVTGKVGMGGGDIKLLAMIGAFIGLQGVLFTIFIASATGSVIGLLLMFYTRSDMKLAVPFGPFLSLGATSYVFFGPGMINWYFNLIG